MFNLRIQNRANSAEWCRCRKYLRSWENLFFPSPRRWTTTGLRPSRHIMATNWSEYSVPSVVRVSVRIVSVGSRVVGYSHQYDVGQDVLQFLQSVEPPPDHSLRELCARCCIVRDKNGDRNRICPSPRDVGNFPR